MRWVIINFHRGSYLRLILHGLFLRHVHLLQVGVASSWLLFLFVQHLNFVGVSSSKSPKGKSSLLPPMFLYLSLSHMLRGGSFCVITSSNTFGANISKHHNFWVLTEKNRRLWHYVDQIVDVSITIFCSRSTLWISVSMSSFDSEEFRHVIYIIGTDEIVVSALGL